MAVEGGVGAGRIKFYGVEALADIFRRAFGGARRLVARIADRCFLEPRRDCGLRRVEQRAKAMGLDSIFVLTTRTMHWFIKRGFAQVDPDWLPEARKRKYNWDRRSQVLVKTLK